MGSANQTPRGFVLVLIALSALLFASFRFFPSRSDEGAGSIGRGRVFEGLSMCI